MVSRKKIDIVDKFIAQHSERTIEENEIDREMAINIFGMTPDMQDKFIRLFQYCNFRTESGHDNVSAEEIKQYWNHIGNPN